MDICNSLAQKLLQKKGTGLLLQTGAFGQEANYSTLMAPTGHSPSQAPQLTQVSASTTAFSSTILIASTGHAPTQAPQPTQVSLSTTAAILHLIVCLVLGAITTQKNAIMIRNEFNITRFSDFQNQNADET